MTFLAGATFDGRYVYFAPSYQGVAVRFDTHSAFDSRASWSQFDTKTRPVGQVCFVGATFDGRYVYYLPLVNCSPSGAGTPLVTRYDTQRPFDGASSWSTYNDGNGWSGYCGGVFDGRYLYLLPSGTNNRTFGQSLVRR